MAVSYVSLAVYGYWKKQLLVPLPQINELTTIRNKKLSLPSIYKEATFIVLHHQPPTKMFQKLSSLFIALQFVFQISNAQQCVNASFSIPDTVCAGQILPIQNTSTGAGLTYEWDFCPIDMTFSNSLSAAYTFNGYGFSSLDYFKFVKDNGMYISLAFDTTNSHFVIAQSAVDITTWYVSGNNPIANAYTIAGSSKANCFDVIKEGTTWMGLAAYAPTNSLALLTFANGFNGAPTATSLSGISTLDNPASIKLVKHNGDYFAFITNRGDNSLVCLSFGNSMTNAPIQVYKNFPSGANGLYDLDIIPTCGNVVGFASNLNSGNLLKLEFNDDFSVQPTVTTVPTTASTTYGVGMAQEGSNYYVYFTGSDTAFRISYSNDFNATPVQTKYTWGYPEFRDVEVLQDSSRSMFAFACDYFNFFVTLPFPSTPCFNNLYTTDVVPVTSFPNTGNYSFSLTARDSLGSVSTHYKTVTVVSGSATPEFTYVNTCFSSVDSVAFTDQSTGATGWLWNFGDGNSSTLQNPKHIYASSGSFTVSLTINSASGCQFVKAKSITINPQPSVNFSSTVECAGTATQFTDLSSIATGIIASLKWQFGDGDSSLASNPSHAYTTGGSYNATLTAFSDSGCSASATLAVLVKPKPLIGFTSTNACVGDTTSFLNSTTVSDSSTLSYQWYFGDGGSSVLQDPNHFYAGSGSYPLTLIATAGNGCIDSLNSTFVVATPATPDFSFPSTNCRGNSVTFTDLSTGGTVTNWLWFFGDGDSSTLQNPIHIYTTSGSYTVTLSVSIGSACFSSTLKQIIVIDGPTASFTSTTACLGVATSFTDLSSVPAGQTITTYAWSFGDGQTSSTAFPSNYYSSSGLYQALLTVTSSLGCTDTISHTVLVEALPTVSFSFPNLKCEGAVIQFTDNSSVVGNVISGWQWHFGDGTTSANQNPMHAYNGNGSFTISLTATSFAGCSASAQQVIQVNPKPLFTFVAADGCLGNITNFTFNNISSAPFSYLYLFDDGGQSFIQNPQHLYNLSGHYNVELTVVDSNGCTGEYADTVVINDIPNAAFLQLGICQNSPVNFTNQSTISSGTISGYVWDFGDGNSTTDINTSHTYAVPGNYQVILYATATGGCTDTVKKNMAIKPAPAASFTSSGFSSPGVPNLFNNTTTGATSFIWNFGDGVGSSVLTNPSYVYSDTGSFVVTLIASSSFGCTDTTNQNFAVLEPYIDLALKNLSHTISNNILSIHTELYNVGNVAANNYKLEVSFEGGNTIYETSADTVKPTQAKLHLLENQFGVNLNAVPAYYCVKILKVNGVNDFDESNNSKCEALTTEFLLADIAPNPALDQITLNYYLPYDDVVEIKMYDIRGRQVKQLVHSKKDKGLKQETYNIESLDKGVYFCKLKYRETIIEKRFLKF